MRKILSSFSLAAILTSNIVAVAHADEPIRPAHEWLLRGYQPQQWPAQWSAPAMPAGEVEGPFRSHELPWPVTFASPQKTVAQNYVNFQQYNGDLAYFHGGCDLRTRDNAAIVTPVSGQLEAGYYGYSNNRDGSLTKHWRPWTGRAEDNPYFEVAVVTSEGYRFEFHHVNSFNLPTTILEKLRTTNATVQKNEVIGFVNGAPFPDYQHLHYNIIAPTGARLNPEFYSFALADKTAPVVVGLYAVDRAGKVTAWREHDMLGAQTQMLVIDTYDRHDDDFYLQTPVFAQLQFDVGGGGSVWDFTRVLTGPMGLFPDIQKVFTMSLRANGAIKKTWGQFGDGEFLINLPIGTGSGPFTITIGDTQGNATVVHGILASHIAEVGATPLSE